MSNGMKHRISAGILGDVLRIVLLPVRGDGRA